MNKQYYLEDIGNFIIHLYDKIDGKYFCNHLKLNKLILLSLYNYYSKTDEVFIEDAMIDIRTIKYIII